MRLYYDKNINVLIAKHMQSMLCRWTCVIYHGQIWYLFLKTSELTGTIFIDITFFHVTSSEVSAFLQILIPPLLSLIDSHNSLCNYLSIHKLQIKLLTKLLPAPQHYGLQCPVAGSLSLMKWEAILYILALNSSNLMILMFLSKWLSDFIHFK